MAHKTLKGKDFVWYHFPELEEVDFQFLEKQFKFHPLDFDDLRGDTELPKLDVYKYYLFAMLNIPSIDTTTHRVSKLDLAVFIGKDYIVTASRQHIDSVDRFFARATRSSGLRRDAMGKSPGYFLYKLLDYVFRDSKVVLQELVRKTNQLEEEVYGHRTRRTTQHLGVLRRNILFLRHIIDPQRILIDHFINARKSFISKDLQIYYDDIKDALDGIWVVTDNLKNIIDSLFDVNEALLSHRTNQIIRVLTVISVVLMPPTLISSYYGMNVQGLPFADNIGIVSFIILTSLIGFLAFIWFIDRRR